MLRLQTSPEWAQAGVPPAPGSNFRNVYSYDAKFPSIGQLHFDNTVAACPDRTESIKEARERDERATNPQPAGRPEDKLPPESTIWKRRRRLLSFSRRRPLIQRRRDPLLKREIAPGIRQSGGRQDNRLHPRSLLFGRSCCWNGWLSSTMQRPFGASYQRSELVGSSN